MSERYKTNDAGDGLRVVEVPASEAEDSLDREHQSRLTKVEMADYPKAAAVDERSLITEEEQALQARRNGQGSDKHVDAIRKSGWLPYLPTLRVGARLAWILDSILWMGLWASIWLQWVRVMKND